VDTGLIGHQTHENPLFGRSLVVFGAGLVVAAVAAVLRANADLKHRARITDELRSSAPSGFRVTDELIGEDRQSAIHLDRHRGQFLLWQGSLASIELYDASAIRTIEYCEDGHAISIGAGAGIIGSLGAGIAKTSQKVSTIHLRLQLADLERPYVSLCFMNKRDAVTRSDSKYHEASESAREWKARLEFLSETGRGDV
jgi:hypothetical protein